MNSTATAALRKASTEDEVRAVARLLASADTPAYADAVRALQGRDRLGMAFAKAVDEELLRTRNEQRYGTVVARDSGEPVLWGLNDPAGDEERHALGLRPLADVRTSLWREREAAARVAAGGALLAERDIARVWRDAAPPVHKWLVDTDRAVVRDGDDLVFCWRGRAEQPSLLLGWVAALELQRAGDDLWWVALRARDVNAAAFTWLVLPNPAALPTALAQAQVWRGPAAPPEPPRSTYVRGDILVEQAVDRDGAARDVRVYLPPQRSDQPYPLLVTTDGWLNPALVEGLVERGDVPPLVVVAVASATDADARRDEYVPGRDVTAHERHHGLLAEVCRRAAAEWHATDDSRRRAIFGMSNGASFALSTALDDEPLFGHVLAFSPAAPVPTAVPTADVAFYLCSGSWEREFDATTREVAERLLASGAPTFVQRVVGGHDVAIWEPALALALREAFGVRG